MCQEIKIKIYGTLLEKLLERLIKRKITFIEYKNFRKEILGIETKTNREVENILNNEDWRNYIKRIKKFRLNGKILGEFQKNILKGCGQNLDP